MHGYWLGEAELGGTLHACCRTQAHCKLMMIHRWCCIHHQQVGRHSLVQLATVMAMRVVLVLIDRCRERSDACVASDLTSSNTDSRRIYACISAYILFSSPRIYDNDRILSFLNFIN
jgi:hypothetical protein